jgi:hypothetical protein
MQTDYLAQEARVLDVSRDETVEQGIVNAILAGPSAASLELTQVFEANVTVSRVQREENGMATVVFGQQFLNPPQGAPDNWKQHEYWGQEVPRRRRLALQAVTAALTENGRCSSVQYLVASTPGDVQGMRMMRALFEGDAEGVNAATLMPPQTRPEEAILTPNAVLLAALDAWQRKDWPTLYLFLARTGTDGAPLPSETEFMNHAETVERSLLSYKVSTGTVGIDGATATLCVDLQVRREDGQTVDLARAPVPMARERDSWKLGCDTLLRFLEE